MEVHEILAEAGEPAPYEEGTATMWTDPYISSQLVEAHLDPDSDAASRRAEQVDATTAWILDRIESDEASILDLGCGPGLYAERFARAGHEVTGVDFSEAAIERARERAARDGLDIDYRCGDYLETTFGEDYDVVVLVYCDFGALTPDQREALTERVYEALVPSGRFVFDVLNERTLDGATFDRTWTAEERGFWCDDPYLCLSESFHYPGASAILDQDIVVADGDVDVYRHWNHYFDPEEVTRSTEAAGFDETTRHQQLVGGSGQFNGDSVDFYVATK